MSQEQLGRIESAVGRIGLAVEQLQLDVAEIKIDVAGLKTDVAGLKTDVARLDAGQVELGRHMRLLHEDAIGRIEALRPEGEQLATRRELADLKEAIDRKLDPLLWVVQSHSREIAELQRLRDGR